MARTAPVPNIPAIPGMCPGIAVLGGGGGSGGSSGKGAGSGDGSVGAGSEGGAGVTDGDGRAAGAEQGAEAVSHPIDVATGRAFTDPITDFRFPGPLPLRFERSYSSTMAHRNNGLGFGWGHSFGWEVRVKRRRVRIRTDRGLSVDFEPLEVGEQRVGRFGWVLRRDDWGYGVDTGNGVWYVFSDKQDDGERYRLTAIQDRNGNRIQLAYEHGRLSTVTDAVGRVIMVDTDATGRITALRTHNAPSRGQVIVLVRYSYDNDGNLVTVTDAAGHNSRYEYDTDHRLVRDQNRTGLTFHFRYDDQGRCVESWGDYPSGVDPSLASDVPSMLADGSTVARGVHHTRLHFFDEGYTEVADSKQIRRYETNAHGLVDKKVDGGNVTSSLYDEHGYLVERTDGEGATTTWKRDTRGRIIELIDPLGRITKVERGASGEISQLTDPQGGTTTVHRDSRGNSSTIIRPDGSRSVLSRNEQGQVTDVVFANGGRSTIQYDDHQNPTRLTLPSGAQWQWSYDFLGRRTAEVDPTGATKRFVHNERGDLTAVQHPNGAHTQYHYDGEGRPVRVVDPLGHATEIGWGGLNRLCRRVDANGATVELRYDREGELTAIHNEAGEVTQFQYDLARQLGERIDFDGSRTRFNYDHCGRPTRITNGAEEIIDIVYNAAGEIIEEHLGDGTVIAFNYNQRGEVIGGQRPGSSVRFQRDAAGRIVREDVTAGEHNYWTEMDYDPFGRVIARRSSLGYEEIVERNEDGHRVKTTLNEHEIHHELDPLGREVARRLASGGCIESSYDMMGRLSRRLVSLPGAGQGLRRGEPDWVGGRPSNAAADTAYAYDPRAELVTMDDGDLGSLAYHYDPIGQLLAVVPEQAKKHLFRYDAVGNVFEDDEGAPDRSYGPGNRLVRRGATDYIWDTDGRLSEKRVATESGSQIWRYQYDGVGVLSAVIRPDGATISFLYDAFGRRLKKQLNRTDEAGVRRQTTTTFVYSVGVMVHEITRGAAASGDPIVSQKSYCFEDDRFIPLAHHERQHDAGEPGQWYHYVNDAAGAPLRTVSASGKVGWTAPQRPWGSAESEQGAGTTPLRFQGQYADEETGLCHHLARYYDPGTGHFISRDPLGPAGGLHGYRYATNPISWVDPLGLVSHTVPGAEPPVTDTPGTFTLNAHANSSVVQLPSGVSSDPKAIADYIRAQPGYTEGTPVRLAACSAGAGSNSIAEQLSKEMGVPVTAPDNTLWVRPDGTHRISSSNDGVDNSGSWKTFDP